MYYMLFLRPSCNVLDDIGVSHRKDERGHLSIPHPEGYEFLFSAEKW
jgi:hypothetical protein